MLDKQLADRQLAILRFVIASARNSLGFCRSRSTSQQSQALRKDWLRLICRTNSAAWSTKQSKPEMNAWQVLLVESRSLYNYSFQRTVKNCAFQIRSIHKSKILLRPLPSFGTGQHPQVCEARRRVPFLTPPPAEQPPLSWSRFGHGFRHGYQSASIITSHRRNGGNLLKTYRTHRNISFLIVIRLHAWKGDFGSEGWGFDLPLAHHFIL